MSQYAIIKDNNILEYPYDFGSLQAENPYTNFGDNYDVAYWYPLTQKAIDDGSSIVVVQVEPIPFIDPDTQRYEQAANPTFSEGVWSIGWNVKDITAEEIEHQLIDWRNSITCTPFQGRMALADAGILANVLTAIDGADEKTKTAWEYALEWKRNSPMIATLMAALNISDSQADDLFKAASQITA